MAILGLDLGTSCGWAIRDDFGNLHSGTWDLKPRPTDPEQTAWLVFWRRLNALHQAHKIKLVAYERVEGHVSMYAGHVYGGFKAVLQMFADFNRLRIDSIHTGTLKKLVTGNGRATKEMMIAIAQEKWPSQNISNSEHDRADALHVLDWIETEKGRIE